MLGTIAVVGLAPTPVLIGFAIFYIATALYYRLPIPVQPMKAVAAVLLTAGIGPAGLAASGVMIGVALLVLGFTGWITRLARLVPQSVLAGLQVGLGLALALVSFNLMATAPAIAMVTLGLLLGLLLVPRCPSALIALTVAIMLAQVLHIPGMRFGAMAPVAFSIPSLPSLAEMQRAFSLFVLPQLIGSTSRHPRVSLSISAKARPASMPCARSRSASVPARSSGCSDRAGRARARSSMSSAASSSRTRDGCSSTAR
jgi:hypothetical protein